MKSSIEFKKSEQKLNAVCRQIKSKEQERDFKKDQIENGKVEIKKLKIAIKENANSRFDLNEELNNIQSQLKKNQDEMNRIKAGLLYKTKREYEEMIRRFENEQQNNGRRFSPHEEARLLQDIKIHKQGINEFEKYEEKKKIYDQLKELFSTKKNQQDENWNKVNELKRALTQNNENNKLLNQEINNLENEITQLHSQKVDLKKLMEDLTREYLMNKQQAKKHNDLKNSKYFKQDDALVNMEANLRELNKLINYFQKRLFPDDSQENTISPNSSSNFLDYLGKLTTTTPNISNKKLQSKMNILSSSSSSSSLISLTSATNTQSFNQACNSLEKFTLNDSYNQVRPSSLNIAAKDYPNFEDENDTDKSSRTIETSSALTTPYTPNDDMGGLFIMKKKIDEDLIFNRKKITRKFKTNKSSKISHPLDVITALSKMNIPINMSSQFDECLKILLKRRDGLLSELNDYKNSKLEAQNKMSSTMSSESNYEKLEKSDELDSNNNKNISEPGLINKDNISIISDANSDISSCLDSNYESDYSISSLKRDQFVLNKTLNNSKQTEPVKFSLELEDDAKESNIGEDYFEKKLKTGFNNSDDSDVTINDLQINDNESSSLLLSTKLSDLKNRYDSNNTNRNENNSNDCSSSGSNNTLAPCSPKTQTFENLESLNTIENIDVAKSDHKTEILNSDINENSKLFARQLSDGYSSSYTPLSASSINNEQPNKNPFFNNSLNNQDTK